MRDYLRDHELTNADVAGRLGLSEPTIRSWLNGNRAPNLSDVMRFCEAVKADPAVIIFGAPLMTPSDQERIVEATRAALRNIFSAKDK